MKPTVIAVSGVDGSGKSTFIKRLRETFRDDETSLEVATLWLRFDPRAQGFRRSGSGVVSTVDRSHRGHPLKRLARTAGGRRIWVEAAVRRYVHQLDWQLGAVHQADLVLADRFVLDFCADLIAGGVLRMTEVDRVLVRLPTAIKTIVLTAEPEVLIARKHPNEDGDQLVRRRDLYLELARRTNAAVLDTTDEGQVSGLLGEITAEGRRQ